MDTMLKNVLFLIESKYQNDIDFEKDFNIARSTVSAWRKGKLKSYRKMSNEIASFFSVSLDWLSGNEQKNKPTVSSEPNPRDKKIMELFESLNDKNKKLALAQIELILKSQDNK